MNYIAMIGDIKDSRKIKNRRQVQERLNTVLKSVNETYCTEISANFIIMLGDEFQGLLKTGENVLDIVKYIQNEMYPVKLRIGIGIGEISTNFYNETAIGADGPAYYAAREVVEQLHEQEKKLKKQAADIQISIYGVNKFEITEINTLLALIKIIELGIGHLLGDFYFQNERIASYKEETYKGVLLHSLEYYVVFLVVMLPVFSFDMILGVTYAAAAHFVIDTIKCLIPDRRKFRRNKEVFVIDQCAHIVSILALAYIMYVFDFSIEPLGIIVDILSACECEGEILARWILAVLLIHIPVNLLIQISLEDYKPKGDKGVIKSDNKAGRRIGSVERLIMLVFLSRAQYAAIGFVLTAKSIARYDKITKDEQFAEYYLLGTLISTLCVVICSILILC